MSVSVYRTEQLENSASGLRYGLIDVEPFEEEKIVKKFGLKFRERRWGLKPSASFHDFLRFNTEAIIQSIALPSHLNCDTLIEMIAKKRIEAFEGDTELKRLLEETRKEKSRMGLRQLVQFFVDRQRSSLDDAFNDYATLFLASDLQLSLISDFTNFEVTYMASLEAILSIAKYHTVWMNLPGANFQKYQRYFSAMKFRLSPIIDQVESAVFRARALKWYILLSNTDTAETAFEPKTIEKSRMDSKELDRLHFEFRQDSTKLRKIIMEQDPSDKLFHPLVGEPGLTSHFGEVVMALTS